MMVSVAKRGETVAAWWERGDVSMVLPQHTLRRETGEGWVDLHETPLQGH